MQAHLFLLSSTTAVESTGVGRVNIALGDSDEGCEFIIHIWLSVSSSSLLNNIYITNHTTCRTNNTISKTKASPSTTKK